jgi:hypothetical protein
MEKYKVKMDSLSRENMLRTGRTGWGERNAFAVRVSVKQASRLADKQAVFWASV